MSCYFLLCTFDISDLGDYSFCTGCFTDGSIEISTAQRSGLSSRHLINLNALRGYFWLKRPLTSVAIMGQSSSSERDSASSPHNQVRLSFRPLDGASTLSPGHSATGSTNTPSTSYTTPSSQEPRPPRPVTTFSRQISSQSVSTIINGNDEARDSSTQGDVFFEGHITNISASPMPRRSRLSRLNSALGFWQGRAERQDSSGHEATLQPAPRTSSNSSNLPRRSYRRRENALRPQSLSSSPHEPSLSSALSTDPQGTNSPEFQFSTNPITQLPNRAGPFSRLRNSITSHLDIIERRRDRERHSTGIENSARLLGSEIENEPLPSRLLDHPGNSSDALIVDGADADARTSENASLHGARANTDSEHEGRAWPEGLQFSNHHEEREGNQQRANESQSRSSRITSQDLEHSWSQVSSAIAMAIATQISENTDSLPRNPRALRFESVDAVFQPINHILQHAVRAHSERNLDRSNGSTPSLNFLRVFRFGSTSSSTSSPSISSPAMSEANDDFANGSDHINEATHSRTERNLKVLVVAVHSAVTEPATSTPQAAGYNTGPTHSFDPMANLPPLDETSNTVLDPFVEVPRQITRRSRFAQLRRASHRVSSGNLRWLQDRDQNHWRASLSSSVSGVDDSTQNSSAGTLLGHGDSPPGPVPPPSTPAEHTSSAVSSQPATPSRRHSTVSSLHRPSLGEEQYVGEGPLPGSPISHSERTLRFPRYRRRIDSESARFRHFGAGAARRNGVVEPDSVEEGDERSSRNWLVYVVGTNLSGDHPAWATPNMFSDVSSSSRSP